LAPIAVLVLRHAHIWNWPISRAFGTRTLLVFTACAVVGFQPSPVAASAFLNFDPPGAVAGTAVRVQSVGAGAFEAVRNRELRLFLAPIGSSPSTVDDLGLQPIATLTVDDAGNARGTFETPDLLPGMYDAWAYCPPCATFSAGRSLLPVGQFEVREGLANWGFVSGVVFMVVVAVAAITAVLRTRRNGTAC